MPALLIGYRVANATTGTRVLEDDRAARRAYGAGREHLYQHVADPATTLLLIEWDGDERAWLYARSDELRDLMRRAGSTGVPQVWVLADDGSSNQVWR